MPLGDDVHVDTMVASTDGYSGAEMVAVCREAALTAMRGDLQCTRIMHAHFAAALKLVRAGTDPTTITMCESFEKGAGGEL